MIIGLSGRLLSGKDTLARIILVELAMKNRRIIYSSDNSPITCEKVPYIKKFAGKLKQLAALLLGVPVGKFEDQEFKASSLGEEWDFMTVREFLQKLGTNALRDCLHKNVHVNALFADYKQGEDWIITDVRFRNEAEAIKSRRGIVVRLTRNKDVPASHESETELDNYDFDYIIDNDGKTLEETIPLVTEFLDTLWK